MGSAGSLHRGEFLVGSLRRSMVPWVELPRPGEISKTPSFWDQLGTARKPTENAGVQSTDIMRVGLFLTGDCYLGKLNGEHMMADFC